MCFLYRQSISIVYESKFKYIYRYFIKIDRCFCGILQSLPLRKCGLKSYAVEFIKSSRCVTSLAEVWIEIPLIHLFPPIQESLPLRKCGLKLRSHLRSVRCFLSLPLRKCGLKYTDNALVYVLPWSLPLRKCGLKYG